MARTAQCAMRTVTWGRGRGQTSPMPASQYPSEQIVKNSKVWVFRSTLEFRRSQIEAELGEFVEADEKEKT